MDPNTKSEERGENLADRLLAIGKDCAARLKESFRSADHAALLYGERGLPRGLAVTAREVIRALGHGLANFGQQA